MQIYNINPNYISAEYEVVSNIALTNLTVNILNNKYGAIIRDVNNNVVNDFKSLKKFKVLIPISNLGGNNIAVDLNITAKTTEYNAYYGTAEASHFQDIGVAILDPVVRNLNATATYNNSTNLNINVKNKNGGLLKDSTVKVINPMGQDIGKYITDDKGNISLKYITPGRYKVELLSVPKNIKIMSSCVENIDIEIQK